MVCAPCKGTLHGFYRALMEGLLGFVKAVLTMAHIEPWQ